MVRNITEIEKLIHQVETNDGVSVNTRYVDCIEELRNILTNKSIKFQDGWKGMREHIQEIMAVGTTAPDKVSIGVVDQYEYLDYDELIDSYKKEVPATFDPNEPYAILVKEEDLINYQNDYMHEKQYTVYYYGKNN